MEFHGTWSVPISLTGAVPWNSMELGMRQFRWHEQFHGIPWNWECANFDDTSSSMEFHGTRSVPISMTRAVPWNSMEFHGTWNAQFSMTRAVPWNSMELGVRYFRWHEQFHGIPWNSMELEVRQFRWHEMFHGIHAALYRGRYCPKESNPAITKKPAGDVDIPTSHEHRLFNGCNKTCILRNVILAPSWYPSIHYDVIK